MQIHQLIYESLATVAITPSQLEALLPAWRAQNHAAGLSGLLLYGKQRIIQVLEGDAQHVQQLYQRIARDVRHYHVHTLANDAVPARAFGQWSMGFVELSAPDLSRLAGYVSPAQPAGLLPGSPQVWPELTALLQEFSTREQYTV